mmetsp:Transcript_9797/g.18306  ORF Transcript_9797/g.18306 Transcript_9797/m.18306 type:complete len:255 (-) Transcript_9797:407-1171(-)|eukprot:CAMPEP_0175062460 /NCGR_PEP_ID=MMETSP0052_2-20121109/14181_1 /TAXON_ID=51329 ORGANISM="Polytomella parva, Strain SAG 63-3" /NCGR_SAMPLE_ID=MMETSP0052_2 /ASSEMBLY_ACC=CAM_ASM_000194 /LENGTH=254 /DNA_ID=CAMNT_0016328485 /DNA_START=24 /DNA_END=788 /DNA_ORIENTATION=+
MSEEHDPSELRGHFDLTIHEADGNVNGIYTWDPNVVPFEGFVKIEIRGGSRNVKDQTARVRVDDDGKIVWNQTISLELLKEATELRLIFCKDRSKRQVAALTRKTPSVIAACGIYVDDILKSAPFEKKFELYKPNSGTDRGTIKLSLGFRENPLYSPLESDTSPEVSTHSPEVPKPVPEAPVPKPPVKSVAEPSSNKRPKRNLFVSLIGTTFKLIVFASLGAGAVAAGAYAVQEFQKKQKELESKKAEESKQTK